MNLLRQVYSDLANAIQGTPTLWLELEKQWVPVIEREKLKDRKMILSPDSRRSVMQSRGSKRNEIHFVLGVVDPLDEFRSNDDEAAELGHDLVDELIDGLLGKSVLPSKAYIARIEQPVATVPEMWREYRQFTTFLKFELEV